MKYGIRKIFALGLCGLLAAEGVAFAQVDQSQLNQIKDQIAVLQSKMANIETGSSAYVPPAEGEGKGFFDDVQVGGHMDVQYNQNLTRGGNAIAGGNTGRIFDTDRESFTVNATEINVTKAANPEGGAGFRFDVLMGEDAQVVNGDGAAADKFDLQQAYIEYTQPLGMFADNEILPQSINLKAGRFVTLAGLEVIESQNNWNASRSFTFGLAIPFVHTGVRSNFKMFNEALDIYLGMVNGWDNAVDNNKDKTLESAIGYKPLENVSMFHTIYWGHEGNDASGNAAGGSRFLNTNVMTVNLTEALSVAGEVNIGNQRRASATMENVQWYSFAGYARYQLAEKWALAYRGELFRDQELFRTALDRTIWSQTFTLEHNLADNLITRLEYRYDKADNLNAFGGDSSQQTIGAQVLYLIG